MSKRKTASHGGGHHSHNTQGMADDLAFAATFATAYVTSTSTIPTNEDEPSSSIYDSKMEEETVENSSIAETDIEIKDGNRSHESDTGTDIKVDKTEDEKEGMNHNNQIDDDDSGDESDVDLTKFLTQMQEDEGKEHSYASSKKKTTGKNRTHAANASTSTNIPKTQNEVDLYNCPIEDLKKLDILDLDINAGGGDKNNDTKPDEMKSSKSNNEHITTFQNSNNDFGIMNATIPTNRLIQAGVIKCHLVSERTIVVESANAIGSNLNNFNNQNPLLDEGTLLVLKVSKRNDCDNRSSSTNENNNDEKKVNLQYDWMKEISSGSGSGNMDVILPIGKILEVFGPVSKPLYTIRLLLSTNHCRSPPLATGDNDDDNTDPIKEDKKEEELAIKEEEAMIEEEGQNSEKSKKEGDEEDDANNQCKSNKVIGKDDNNGKPIAKGDITPSTKKSVVDPWFENGVLTEWIASYPKLEVYYTSDQVKFVDTQSVARNSRNGCDASNIYDEEVVDVKDMYFSDDEEEKRAKQRSKKKYNKNSTNQLDNELGQASSVPHYREHRGRGNDSRGRRNQRHQHNQIQHSSYASHPPPPIPPQQSGPPPPIPPQQSGPPPPIWNQHQYYNQQQQTRFNYGQQIQPPPPQQQHYQAMPPYSQYPYNRQQPPPPIALNHRSPQIPPPPPPPMLPMPTAPDQGQQNKVTHQVPPYQTYPSHQVQNTNWNPSIPAQPPCVPSPQLNNPPNQSQPSNATYSMGYNQQNKNTDNDTVYYNYTGT